MKTFITTVRDCKEIIDSVNRKQTYECTYEDNLYNNIHDLGIIHAKEKPR